MELEGMRNGSTINERNTNTINKMGAKAQPYSTHQGVLPLASRRALRHNSASNAQMTVAASVMTNNKTSKSKCI